MNLCRQVLDKVNGASAIRKYLILDLIHHGPHQMHAESATLVPAKIFLHIRRLHGAGIERLPVVSYYDFELPPITHNLNVDVMRWDELVCVFDDVCACLIDSEHDLAGRFLVKSDIPGGGRDKIPDKVELFSLALNVQMQCSLFS